MCKLALPHLLRSTRHPHILMLSPPLVLRPAWFGAHLPYTISKYGMSMLVLGVAEECRPQGGTPRDPDARRHTLSRTQGVAVNALWPKTMIQTAALQVIAPPDGTVCSPRRFANLYP